MLVIGENLYLYLIKTYSPWYFSGFKVSTGCFKIKLPSPDTNYLGPLRNFQFISPEKIHQQHNIKHLHLTYVIDQSDVSLNQKKSYNINDGFINECGLINSIGMKNYLTNLEYFFLSQFHRMNSKLKIICLHNSGYNRIVEYKFISIILPKISYQIVNIMCKDVRNNNCNLFEITELIAVLKHAQISKNGDEKLTVYFPLLTKKLGKPYIVKKKICCKICDFYELSSTTVTGYSLKVGKGIPPLHNNSPL